MTTATATYHDLRRLLAHGRTRIPGYRAVRIGSISAEGTSDGVRLWMDGRELYHASRRRKAVTLHSGAETLDEAAEVAAYLREARTPGELERNAHFLTTVGRAPRPVHYWPAA